MIVQRLLLISFALTSIPPSLSQSMSQVDGQSNYFQLSAVTNEAPLTTNFQAALQGTTQKTILLEAGIEQQAGPLRSVQRRGSPSFRLNVSSLQPPKIPIDLQGQLTRRQNLLNGQIEQAGEQIRAALAGRQSNLVPLFSLVPQLQSQVLLPQNLRNMPSQALLDNVSSNIQNQLLNARQNTQPAPPRVPMVPQPNGNVFNSRNQAELEDVSARINSQLTRSKTLNARENTLPPSPQIPMVHQPNGNVFYSRNQAELQDVSARINGQLARRKKLPAPIIETNVDAQLTRAKMQLNNQSEQVAAELRTIFRKNPISQSTLTTNAQIVDINTSVEDVISWDKWHETVSRLSEIQFNRALTKYGKPAGRNTISIIVTSNNRIIVKLVAGTNSPFDLATLEAFRSLDKHPALRFPAGSTRKQVQFFIDNEKEISGDVSNFNSQSIIGDREVNQRK